MPFDRLVALLITGWNAMPDTAIRRPARSLRSSHRRADRESLRPDSVDQFDAADTGKLLSGKREKSICHDHRGRAMSHRSASSHLLNCCDALAGFSGQQRRWSVATGILARRLRCQGVVVAQKSLRVLMTASPASRWG